MKITKQHTDSLQRAVQKAEAGTSAEISWAIVDRSSSYLDAPLILGIVVGFIAVMVKSALQQIEDWGDVSEVSLVVVIPFFILGMILGQSNYIRGLVVSDSRMRRRVLERAQATFFRADVHLTNKHNGVLVFASVFERLIVLVPDKAIAKDPVCSVWLKGDLFRTGKRKWRRPDDVTKDVKYNILVLGGLLREKFPPEAGDKNEVSDSNIGE